MGAISYRMGRRGMRRLRQAMKAVIRPRILLAVCRPRGRMAFPMLEAEYCPKWP